MIKNTDPLPMSNDEIKLSYKNAINQKEQIKILSELNDCPVQRICAILDVDVPGRKKDKEKKDMSKFKMTQEIYDRITGLIRENLTWVQIAERIGHKNFKSLNMSYNAWKNKVRICELADQPEAKEQHEILHTPDDRYDEAPIKTAASEMVPKENLLEDMRPKAASVLKLLQIDDSDCYSVYINYRDRECELYCECGNDKFRVSVERMGKLS